MTSRASRIAAAFLMLVPVFAADTYGELLLEAARGGKKSTVETLLAKGANLESTDKEGRTPLMLSAQYGRTSTVRMLLAKGAKTDLRDSRGWNAYMLALLSPSGGLVHTPHDAVLKLLPQPARFRLAVEAAWTPGKAVFSSCFMRPDQLTEHIRGMHPDAMVVEAFRRFAATSGRDLIAIVRAQDHGLATAEGASEPTDVDAVLVLEVEPGASCVQQSDQLSLLIQARLVRPADQSQLFEKAFGGGVKTGMRGELAANANQYAPLYEAWAKSQASPLYWGVLTALLQSQPVGSSAR